MSIRLYDIELKCACCGGNLRWSVEDNSTFRVCACPHCGGQEARRYKDLAQEMLNELNDLGNRADNLKFDITHAAIGFAERLNAK